jgi:sugar phosphate isomerase/epimerase
MKNTILEKISYHAVYDDSILAALQYAHKNSFKGIQLADESPHLSFERLTDSKLKDIITFIADTGTKISLHAPDEAVSLFISSPSLRKGIEDYFKKLVDFALVTEAQVLTIHLGTITPFRTDTEPEILFPSQDIPIYKDNVLAGLEYLISLTQGEIALCIENYRLDIETLNMIEPYITEGKLFLCWDIAKSINNPELEKYFWNHLHEIRQVHLHDCREKDGKKRSHRVIGSGIIDFQRYLSRFQDSNILDFCIEVRPREKALESFKVLQKIINEKK